MAGMVELRSVTPVRPRPTTETLTLSPHDYPLLTVANKTDIAYKPLSSPSL